MIISVIMHGTLHSMLTVQCIAMGNWMLRKGSIIMAPLLLGFWPLPAKVNSVATSLWYFWQTLMHLCLVSLEWRRLFSLWRCTTVITSAQWWRAWKHWRFCYKETIHGPSHTLSNPRFSSQHLLQPLLWCHIQLLGCPREYSLHQTEFCSTVIYYLYSWVWTTRLLPL